MKIGIIEIGYVGVQLAVAFGQKVAIVGFDPDQRKIEAYKAGVDRTGEVLRSQFKVAEKTTYSFNSKDLVGCSIYIIAVPTPVDKLD